MDTSILIVDDDEAMLESIGSMLNGKGFQVELTTDGQNAFDRLNETIFDIVITDNTITNQYGIELSKAIADYYPAEIIILTEDLNQYIADTDVVNEFADFVHKPFKPEEIVFRVERVLESRRLKEELWQTQKRLSDSQKMESIGQLTGVRYCP